MKEKGKWERSRRGPVGGLFTYEYLCQMLDINVQYREKLKYRVQKFARQQGTRTYDLNPAQIMDFLFQLKLAQSLQKVRES